MFTNAKFNMLLFEQDYWHQSSGLLQESIQHFKYSEDLINTAFVTCNFAKLMRVGYIAALLRGETNARAKVCMTWLQRRAICTYCL